VADIRESPSFTVMELLQKRQADISFHDPYVDAVPPTREHAAFTGMKSVPLTPETVAAADVVMIVTDHDNVDYDMVVKNARLVIDTRNKLAFATDRHNIVKA
ncbi:MAG TPA: UDP binding domain-containing protein, partial [Alphaproteobacteria bacterium]|nr:UDP binding domain-containing protein [Alphaproteobacteria bacterium]